MCRSGWWTAATCDGCMALSRRSPFSLPPPRTLFTHRPPIAVQSLTRDVRCLSWRWRDAVFKGPFGRSPERTKFAEPSGDRAMRFIQRRAAHLPSTSTPDPLQKFGSLYNGPNLFPRSHSSFILHRFLSSGDVTAVHLAERRLVWLYCRPVLVHRACSERRPALTARIRRSSLTAGS